MKKYIVIFIIGIILASVISGGTVYFLMSKNLKQDEKEIKNETEIKYDEKEQKSEEEKKITTSTDKTVQSNQNIKQDTKKTVYSHIALQGCVIIESKPDSSSFTYRKKCESCGNLEPGSMSTSATSGTLNSSFMCSKCKKIQKIQIESSFHYEY